MPRVEYKGETGKAYWQTLQFEGLRVRMIEYSAGYLEDHWCKKGHIVHCLEGEFVTELQGGTEFKLSKGMTNCSVYPSLVLGPGSIATGCIVPK